MVDLTSLPVAGLLELQADLLSELRRRKVVRSANSPTGDYAELLFSKAFGWTLSNNSSADADAIDADGVRYQIKCRRLATPRTSRQLSWIRRLAERPFDQLAAVLLNDRYRALIPFDIVEPRCRYVESQKAWRFFLRDVVWSIPGVVDVTEKLKAAELLV